ncbi:MAG: hypothetical protein MPW14_22865 [Candidatus Manganitrophus sp.]|nr:hypothetical protein [Candidatus Manganitrophus sp.]WDT79925.1 MAG: hypothetical protein MPW14_22865 [Candidatus Manganitrophus sp.]
MKRRSNPDEGGDIDQLSIEVKPRLKIFFCNGLGRESRQLWIDAVGAASLP